ncbi:MAG: TAT-variant-translocated molybdopterin oxidoreductase, partial [Bryobacteraceae bacterium]
MTERKKLDLAALQEKLAGKGGKEYWRSLEDLASSEEFEEMLHREFPRQASEWPEEDGPGRRQFLKIMAASLGLAGLTACTRQPTELIVPYVNQPEGMVLGKPLFYATAMTLGGVATGMLAKSREGRPVKVEGNPEHPASLGAADAYMQASVLGLYDPDRSRALTYGGEIRSWAAFLAGFRETLSTQRATGGAGLRILTETITSPSIGDQIKGILKEFPAARWHQWEPCGPHNARAAAQMAFGQPVNVYYDLTRADVILLLDADILNSGPGHLRYARQFSLRRRVREGQPEMNRLYVIEPMPTPTGAKADHRMPLRASDVEAFATRLAATLGVNIPGAPRVDNPKFEAWLGPLVRDLQAHKGRGLIVAGEHQPPMVHALAHAMNQLLGNVGQTVFYTAPLEVNPVDQLASLRELAGDLDAGKVDLLLILGGNPVFTAPVEMGLRDRIQKARLRVRLGLYDDETSQLCHWHLPETHFLESWSDARAFDGTVTIIQPLIQPLYQGRSMHEVLAMLSPNPAQPGAQIVKGYWQRQHPGADFEAWWRRALHDGVVPGSALPPVKPALRFGWTGRPAPHRDFEIIFRPDPAVYDGRFANSGWLQEWPRPITQLTWDNAAIMSPAMANILGAENSTLVELEYKGRKLRAPVFIQPGHADGCVTLHLGYGRTRAGRAGTGVGFNPYGLRTSDALWQDFGLKVRKTGGAYVLASTQNEHMLDSRRHIIRHADLEEYRKNPDVSNEGAETPDRSLTLYPEYKYEGYAWGMAIDLNACTGCGACVLACQAENNIPVVGKMQVAAHRHMHWLRVDSYYQGSIQAPAIYSQPVPCMHCENAPCEVVCPVQATTHSAEGLNDMVYNRCVGTRYCSNNCPYKVRR